MFGFKYRKKLKSHKIEQSNMRDVTIHKIMLLRRNEKS